MARHQCCYKNYSHYRRSVKWKENVAARGGGGLGAAATRPPCLLQCGTQCYLKPPTLNTFLFTHHVQQLRPGSNSSSSSSQMRLYCLVRRGSVLHLAAVLRVRAPPCLQRRHSRYRRRFNRPPKAPRSPSLIYFLPRSRPKSYGLQHARRQWPLQRCRVLCQSVQRRLCSRLQRNAAAGGRWSSPAL